MRAFPNVVERVALVRGITQRLFSSNKNKKEDREILATIIVSACTSWMAA